MRPQHQDASVELLAAWSHFSVGFKHHTPQPSTICTKNSMKEEPDIFNTTIGMAKTKCVSLPRLKPNGWIMIIQSILQVGVNSADSTEFTGPVEYPKIFSHLCLANHSIVSTRFAFLHHWHHLIEVMYHAHTNNLVP